MIFAVKPLVVNLIVVSLLSVSAAKAGPFGIGDTVTVTENTPNPTGFVMISDTLIGGPYAVYAGVNNLTISGNGTTVTTQGFCIDPYHWGFSGPGAGYSVVALENAPKVPGGPMSSHQAAQISELWALHFNSAMSDTTGLDAAALQVGIWDIVGHGIDGTGIDALKITGDSSIINLATTWVTGVADPSGGPSANLLGLTHPVDGQDYVIANVPDAGATVILLGLAMIGLAVSGRKLRAAL